MHMGGTASLVRITQEERKVAQLAAKTMQLKVAGVDIIRGENGPLLLEVNSSPGLEGIEGISEKNIAGKMIEALEKNLKFGVHGPATPPEMESVPSQEFPI
jgi:ribosomal protein S6--L-glutamate ligase